MKRTYQPKQRQRHRKHGFLTRQRKAKHVLKSRRLKGRKLIAVPNVRGYLHKIRVY